MEWDDWDLPERHDDDEPDDEWTEDDQDEWEVQRDVEKSWR